MDDIWDDASCREWEVHVREKVIPMLRDTAATVSLVPRGEPDVKFAVELGLSILMNKPIIALVRPGDIIPDGLARAAAEIVEVDIAGDPEGAQRSITEAFGRVMHTDARHISLDDVDNDD